MYSHSDITTLTSLKLKSNSCCVIKDHTFPDIIDSLHHDVQMLREKIRPAKMSKSRGPGEEWEDENHRGDSICWVTPQVCKELGLSALDTFIQRMVVECEGAFKEELGLTEDYSCQFAVYPGKGEGYNRHKDAFSLPPPPPPSVDGNPEVPAPRPISRQLTCLLYLNKDWVPEDGGQLRVFTHPGVHIEKGDDPFSFWGVNGYDINPTFGRMIIFRSEFVEHAVLPCFKERMALTFWINGTGPAEKSDESMVFKFDADAPKPTINDDTIHEDSDSDSEDSVSSDSSSDGAVEILYELHDKVEVKLNGLWVDGSVTAIVNARYTVTTTDGKVAENKGRYEVRQPGPKHFGTIHSKTAEEYDWVAFRAKWRDMSEEERGAEDSVVFGAHNTWSCCGGRWNSPPCGRK
jgi:hypothetical protein